MIAPIGRVALAVLAAIPLSACTPMPAIFLRGETGGEVTIVIGACGTTPRVTEIVVDALPKDEGRPRELWRVVSGSDEGQPVREIVLGSSPQGFSATRDELGRLDETRVSLGVTYGGPDDEGSWTFDRLPQPGEVLGPEGVLEDEEAVRDVGC